MGEMIRSKPNKLQVPDGLGKALFRLPMTAVEERANQWRKRHFQSTSSHWQRISSRCAIATSIVWN